MKRHTLFFVLLLIALMAVTWATTALATTIDQVAAPETTLVAMAPADSATQVTAKAQAHELDAILATETSPALTRTMLALVQEARTPDATPIAAIDAMAYDPATPSSAMEVATVLKTTTVIASGTHVVA